MTKVDSSKINIDKNLERVIKKKGKKRNETEGWKERKKSKKKRRGEDFPITIGILNAGMKQVMQKHMVFSD